jgi:hypothetical protein
MNATADPVAVVSGSGQIYECTNDEYHADHSRISRSMLEVFRESPARYHGRFVAGTIPAPEPTPAMEFGSWFHEYALEPDKYLAERIIAPQFGPDGERWNRAKKLHKEAWEELETKANGRGIIDHDTHLRLFDMRRAIGRNENAKALIGLDNGPVEQSIFWVDEEIGLTLKCRRDKVCRDGTLIVDLKTCHDSSPEAFARDAVNFGYHRQAAFYLDGHAAVFGVDAIGMVFVAVSKQQPHDVACYELDYDAIALGRQQNRASLWKLSECIESGEWFAAHERQINTVSLPKWAFYQDQWEVA